MPEPFAAGFKFGFGAVGRGGGVGFGGVLQLGEAAQHFEHLHGVFFPVGGEVDVAAAFEFGQQFGHEGGLNQAAFVMAFFVPGVGEEDVDAA